MGKKNKLDPEGITFAELDHFEIDERSVRLLKATYCRSRRVVVLGLVDPASKDAVTVGMLDPGDRLLIDEVAAALKRPIKPVRLNAREIDLALDRGWGQEEEDARRLVLEPVRAFSFDDDVEVKALLDEVLGRAVELRASDVHFEVYEKDVDVRLRIDGVLRHLGTALSRDNIQAAVSRLKVLADLDVAERRRAQDGRIKATFRGRGSAREVDFRLSIVPGPFGEDAVLRILDSAAPLPLEKIGFAPSVLTSFERLINNPEGLVLVVGPTGSGKTTTLYAALDRVNTAENKILTVEDPIEYHFAKTNQKQISPWMGFADFARAFMRQNPDIILIGEIRDEDTANAAVRAAQTGHLVLSTVHAQDAVRTIARLETLGVPPGQIAGTLLGALAQRLLRQLCPSCRVEHEPSPEEADRFKLGPEERFFRPRGDGSTCPTCGGVGTKGRLGVFELFVLDGELADRVAERAPIHQVRELATARGMATLLEDALAKARAGLISLAEIQRAVPLRMQSDQIH